MKNYNKFIKNLILCLTRNKRAEIVTRFVTFYNNNLILIT